MSFVSEDNRVDLYYFYDNNNKILYRVYPRINEPVLFGEGKEMGYLEYDLNTDEFYTGKGEVDNSEYKLTKMDHTAEFTILIASKIYDKVVKWSNENKYYEYCESLYNYRRESNSYHRANMFSTLLEIYIWSKEV